MMPVHSPRWHRVAALRPQLATPLLQLRRQRLRGETWYLLSARGGARSVRLNAAAWAIAGRLDGRRTVQQLWDELLASGADPPTQDEVIELLSQLREAALLQLGDAGGLPPAPDAAARPRQGRSLIAWRVRLADPTPLLERLAPLQRLLFTRPAAIVWALAVALLLLQALEHAPTLAAHGRRWLATPAYAALALVLYVPIKLVHELAHGMAVRHWGGSVPHAGVTLMLGLPVPWVDASAANAFARRHQRVVVGAAGMMAELALAAIALPLWLALGDGLLRDAMFVTLGIAGVSTLLFNANPLQRLDGYFIASDLLALPNLGPRSRQWWQDVLRRRLLRLPALEPMALARGERPWLAAYAPLSWAYGLLITALAVAWLSQVSALLGLAAVLLLGWQMVLRPPLRLLTGLRRSALAQQQTARRWQRLALAGGGLLALILLLPLPQRTRVQGVVWPPDDAQLRSAEDGFVAALAVADGAPVQAGDVVLQLVNPALQTRLARQEARVVALEAELVQALPAGAALADAQAGDAQAELVRAQAELDRLRERERALTVRAQTAGRVALPQASDLPGRYLKRGALFGQVDGGAAAIVRVALPESEAADLQRGAAVSLRLASSAWQVRPALWLRDGAGAVLQLPSAALSQRHGGPVATDPQDSQDLKPLQPVLLLDLQLAPGTPVRAGERAWARFDSGYSPLAWQLAQSGLREFRRHANPQF